MWAASARVALPFLILVASVDAGAILVARLNEILSDAGSGRLMRPDPKCWDKASVGADPRPSHHACAR